MADRNKLLEQFAAMSHEDKHAKVLVYLDVMRQKTSEFVWLYGIVYGLWLTIDDDTLTDIYTTMVDIVDYGKTHKLDHIVRGLEKQQKMQSSYADMQKKDQEDADSFLDSI